MKKIDKKNNIVKKNELINAKFDNMTALEMKIKAAALSKVKPYQSVLDPIDFSSKDFCDLLGVSYKGMNSYIKSTCRKLARRALQLDIGKNDWVAFSWFLDIKYIQGRIYFKFHPNLEKYLSYSEIKELYTKYTLENIIDMDSKFSIRLYEMLKQFENVGSRKFTLNELKEKMGIKLTGYKSFYLFRQKVLDISKKEINELSDLNIDYEEIKDGTKIMEIKYYIKKKDYDIQNKTNMNLFSKYKISKILIRQIQKKTGYVFDYKELSQFHRSILIDLVHKFNDNIFYNISIQYPRAYFLKVLADIEPNKYYEINNEKDW